MTLFCSGVEWYDFSRSHLSLSFAAGGASGCFSLYPQAEKTDGCFFDFDVFPPDGPEA
jgi:hypothetical protein